MNIFEKHKLVGEHKQNIMKCLKLDQLDSRIADRFIGYAETQGWNQFLTHKDECGRLEWCSNSGLFKLIECAKVIRNNMYREGKAGWKLDRLIGLWNEWTENSHNLPYETSQK